VPLIDQEIKPHFVEQQIQTGDARTGCRVHQPAPDYAGYDVGKRHREQKNAAEKPFSAQARIQ
jgi:hypothetical protein